MRRMGSRGISTGRRHVSLNDNDVDWWQALSPGGLTNHWTAAVPRFAPEDFTDGARIGPEYRWPVTYDELKPHYEFVEQLMTITAGIRAFPQLPRGLAAHRLDIPADWKPIAAAASSIGHELTVMPMAVGSPWLVAGRGTEFNSHAALVEPLEALPEFELRLGCHVTEVLPPDDRGRPGVRFTDRSNGGSETLRADAVVLGAGALASTRLLLASSSLDAPAGIGNDHGVLGTYLHDHLRTWWPFRTDRPLTLPRQVLYMTRREFAGSEPLSGLSWTIGLRRSHQRAKVFVGGRSNDFGVQVFGTMVPSSAHHVALTDEQDDQGDAKIGIAIDYSAAEQDRIRRSYEPLAHVLDEAHIELQRPADGIHIASPGSSVHFGGTVRMHEDPEFGVLDGLNRVHGMPRILVCDKSSFTTGPEKNPTLTMMAISRRAACQLADELTR